jgi:hypothetical protein
MGYADLCDRMANSYSIRKRTWNWTKKLLFHFLYLTVVNSYIVYKSCGGNITHLKFRGQQIGDFVVLSHKENIGVSGVPRG